MTTLQALMTIGLCVLGTMLTRFLPFILFPENKETPKYPGAWQCTPLCGHWTFGCLLFERCKFPWRQSWNTGADRGGIYRHRSYMEEKCTFEYCRRHITLYGACAIHFYRIIIQFYFDRVKKCANISKCQECES